MKLIIFGCGGHARSVADIFLSNEPDSEIVFVDDNAKSGEKILGFPVLKEVMVEEPYFIAIGDNSKREEQYKKVKTQGLISVISRSSYIGRNIRIGTGCFIGNGVHLGPEVQIGTNTIVNNHAIVEHEVKIGSHSHIGPNATISGRSEVGDRVFVGVGATVIDGIRICSDVTVGAGSVVVDDITGSGTYVGVPARKIK